MAKLSNFTEDHFKDLWSRLDDESKSKLFYYSLFDFMSYFEDTDVEALIDYGTIKEELIELVKNKYLRFFKNVDKNNFLVSASSDVLCRFIIKELLGGYKIKLYLESGHFPDLRSFDNLVGLEIKRPITGNNFREYLINIEKQKLNVKNLVVLILFPLLPGENLKRIQRLIDGYHAFSLYLKHKFKNKFVVCCGAKENMADIIRRIAKTIEEFK